MMMDLDDERAASLREGEHAPNLLDLPPGLVREEVFKFCDGASLVEASAASRPLRDAGREAARAQLDRRYACGNQGL